MVGGDGDGREKVAVMQEEKHRWRLDCWQQCRHRSVVVAVDGVSLYARKQRKGRLQMSSFVFYLEFIGHC